jgi:hypothetical protein
VALLPLFPLVIQRHLMLRMPDRKSLLREMQSAWFVKQCKTTAVALLSSFHLERGDNEEARGSPNLVRSWAACVRPLEFSRLPILDRSTRRGSNWGRSPYGGLSALKIEVRGSSRAGGALLATAFPVSALLRREQLVVEVDNFPPANQGNYCHNCERVEELYCGV